MKEKSINLEVPRILSMVREPRKKLVRIKKTLSLLERDITNKVVKIYLFYQ